MGSFQNVFSRGEAPGADDRQVLHSDTPAEGLVRRLLRDRRDLRGELVEIPDAEAVADRRVERLRDAGVGTEIDLEPARARALLLVELARADALAQELRRFVEGRSDGGVAHLRL